MRLILVRHGQSEGNAAFVVQGRKDFSLSELGRRQAHLTAERLADVPVDRMLSSPLLRAAETASIIAGRVGIAWDPAPDLLEYDVGEVSGLTGAEIRERFPEVMAQYATGRRPIFPGAEGRDTFYARLRGFLDRSREQDGTTVAVAHGGVIGALCYAALGVDYTRPGIFQSANCSLTEITLDRGGRYVLARHNDTCHLRGLSLNG
ncbi:MAG TPA: histidine phosphatase family protein [Tepidiformaceae bacterium]|nr:histidine phosphatase family protein [Tepidiformaceae bacterium]